MQWGASPAATPREIVNFLSAEIVKMRKQPDFVERYVGHGMNAVASTPEAFALYMEREINKWSALIKAANIKPE